MEKQKIILTKENKKILELPLLEDLEKRKVSWPLDVSILIEDKGIYFLFDKEMNLLYIGRTNNLRVRLNNHLSPNNRFRSFNTNVPLNCVKYFSFIKMNKKELRSHAEHIYLMIYKTCFNKIF